MGKQEERTPLICNYVIHLNSSPFSLFSSTELKAQVSFSYRLLSSVSPPSARLLIFHLFTFHIIFKKQPNWAQSTLVCRGLKFLHSFSKRI